MWKKLLASFALAASVVVGGSLSATAQGVPELSADPASIAVGEESTITATGLGGLETASFGLDATPGGTLVDPTTDQEVAQYDAPVDSGEATVRFRSSEPGTFTIAVGTGETVSATTTVTVEEAATPTPEPTVTETMTPPTPEPTMTTQGEDAADAGLPVWAIVLIIVLAVIVIGAVITIVVLVARRGRSGPTS